MASLARIDDAQTVHVGTGRRVRRDGALPGVVVGRIDGEAANGRGLLDPMDVCAFVGIAPRGPAWEIVDDSTWQETVGGSQPEVPDRPAGVRLRSAVRLVDSWQEYERLYGGDSGPGLLGASVAAYFRQGARRAAVVRIVAALRKEEDAALAGSPQWPPGCARWKLDDGLNSLAIGAPRSVAVLRARNEGTWGSGLRCTVRLRRTPVSLADPPGASRLTVPAADPTVVGDLLLVDREHSTWVTARRPVDPSGARWASDTTHELLVDPPLPTVAGRAGVVVERLTADLELGAPAVYAAPSEHFADLGLSPSHPRFLGRILQQASELVELEESSWGRLLPTDPRSAGLDATLLAPGRDRWDLVEWTDFTGIPAESGLPTGLHIALEHPEVASLCVPDLAAFSPAAPASGPPPVASAASGRFEPCGTGAVVAPRPPRSSTAGLRSLQVDVTDPAGLETVIGRQSDVVDACRRRDVVALLDVPPGLDRRRRASWSHRFDSAFAAGYHPWLLVAAQGSDRLTRLPPSAVAAGLVAVSESIGGVPRGPANLEALGVVGVTAPVLPEEATELLSGGVNLFDPRRNGVMLASARTTSPDPQRRQLSVRRLVSAAERSIRRQLQWVVFEPSGSVLRAQLWAFLRSLGDDLFAAGALAGATPRQSYFVHVSDPSEGDPAEVVCQMGIAPAEPLEFIVLDVVVHDGVARVTSATGGARA